MQQYKLAHPTNIWTDSLKSLEKDISSLNKTVHLFTTQLSKDDEIKDINPELVSDCAINCPRLGGHFDKLTNVAHEIAFALYPMDSSDKKYEVKRDYTYIKYQRTLSTLSRIFKTEREKEEAIKNEFKNVRKNTQRQFFCTLKNLPPSKLVTDPVPMPVTVAPLEELEPFFKHLAENQIVNEPNRRFLRGIQYNDGRMDLCKQVVGPQFIGDLMQSLKKNTQVEHFLLGNNIINTKGAEAISEFINGNFSKMKTWYLAGNELNSQGIMLICQALQKDKKCEALWLKRNPIGPQGAIYIGDMLTTNDSIKILDLHNTGLLDEGITHIFTALKKNTSLRHLYCDANAITVIGAKVMAEYFDYLTKNSLKGVTSIWLDINRLDDEGTIVLAKSLRNYTHLKSLVIGSNRMTDVGAKVLCESLVQHKKLRVLDLGLYKSTSDLGELPNNIGDVGMEYINNFIENNNSVEVLSILHNNISLDKIEDMANSLQKNNKLKYIYYVQYGLHIPQETDDKIRAKLSDNINKEYGLTYGDFIAHKLRLIRLSKRIKNIDSLYRNSSK